MSTTKGSAGGPRRDPWHFQRWAYRTRVGNPARRLVLIGLSLTCEGTTGYGWLGSEWLAGFAECSVATVRGHLNALEGAGLVARRREYRGTARTADAFLLLADEWAAWPGDEPLVREAPSHAANGQDLPGGVSARPSRVDRVPVRVEVPNWGELDERQRRVLVELRRFADVKGASLDEMRALAACRDFADRDHVGAAEKFAAWFVEGPGAARQRSDANATWRKWLVNEDPAPAARSAVAETGDLDRFDFGAEDGE
jgi:DNA-binding transcriptional ArsR family regulator